MKLSRNSASIKNVKNIKTCWFLLENESTISKPRTLHSSSKLELGDLFINKFAKDGGYALQIWMLTKAKGSTDVLWKQVRHSFLFGGLVPDCEIKVVPNEKTYHPKLKDRILSFRPSDARTEPTWIKPGTNRPSRAMPLIV